MFGGARSVYTPGFAVNGLEQRFQTLGKRWLNSSSLETGIITLEVASGAAVVKFSPREVQGLVHLNLVLMGSDLQSEVTAGENRGRSLNHHFVALYWDEKVAKSHDGQFAATFLLPHIPRPDANNLSIAAWASDPENQTPQQATGGPLPKPLYP